MTREQSKLAWSWVIGGITLSIAIYLQETEVSYSWVVPMIIGMPIVRYLREGIDSEKNNIFHYMSERMKLYTAIYMLFLAGFLAYSLTVNPKLVGNNVGVFMILALLPIIIVYIKIDLKLYFNLGNKNA